MARKTKRSYSAAEKSALVADVERLYRVGSRTYASIARELGMGANQYHSWVRQGVQPALPAELPVRAAQRVFGAAEQAQLVADVDALRARGTRLKPACLEAGISDKSYYKWKAAMSPSLPMRPVEVTALVPTLTTALMLVPPRPAPAGPTLTLVAPGGYRIEGLCIADAARLLRALA